MATLVMGGCTSAYVEGQHISSVRDGPFPSWREENSETEVNTLGIGLRRDYRNGVYLDGALHWQVGAPDRSELEGASPFFRGVVGWKFWER